MGQWLCDDSKCGGECPPGVPIVQCLVDPCEVNTCDAYPDAACEANYCGGCNAVFYGANGQELDCDPGGGECDGGTFWNECGSACTSTCADPYPVCIALCVSKCECPAEKPIWHNGQCVYMEACEGEPMECIPGESEEDEDGCNTCTCGEEGAWWCTDQACPDKGCEYGDTWYPAGAQFDGVGDNWCNSCWCGEDGSVACTEMACEIMCDPDTMPKEDCLDCECHMGQWLCDDSKCGGNQCPGGMIWYGCGSACTPTCADPYPNCTMECVAKCACPADYPILQNGQCITLDECTASSGCAYKGAIYQLGEEFTVTNPVGCEVCVCSESGVICVDVPCDGAGPGCGSDDDCPATQWCRPTAPNGGGDLGPSECVDYQEEGEPCGGFTPYWALKKCAPGVTCADMNPMLADEPGICTTPLPDVCDTPGSTHLADDLCNICMCLSDGTWACNDTACTQMCNAGDTKPDPDGCNSCTCSDPDGWPHWNCTKMACPNFCEPGATANEGPCKECMCAPNNQWICTDTPATCPDEGGPDKPPVPEK